MSPLLYLSVHSLKNLLKKRLKRFGEPKYLLGMLVFVFYVYGMLHRPMSAHPGRSAVSNWLNKDTALGAAMALLIAGMAGSWIFSESGALAFTMAEASILFPAPISRSALLRSKILKAQLPILLSCWIFYYFTRNIPELRAGSTMVGGVVAFEIVFMNRLAAALARVPRVPRDRPGLAAYVGRAIAWLVVTAIALSFLRFPRDAFPERIGEGLALCVSSPPASFLLVPFRLLLAPALAQTPLELLQALPFPLAIFLAYYVWIVHGGVAFEESALVASETKQKAQEVFKRTGRRGPVRPVKSPIRLAPTGNRMTALAWKNYLAISRRSPGTLIFLIAFLLGGTVVLRVLPETAQASELVGTIAAMLAAMTMLMLPDFLRADLRSSLRGADLLKTFPMPGWAVCLGEMAAPVLVTFVVQVTLLGMGAIALPVSVSWRVAGWLSAIIVLLPIDLLFFAIANGAALCFPAWVPLGPRVERGGEQFGVNLLLRLGRLTALALGLIPSVLVGGIAAFLLLPLLGPWALPIVAFLGSCVLAAEDGLVIWFLGGVLERFDPARDLG